MYSVHAHVSLLLFLSLKIPTLTLDLHVFLLPQDNHLHPLLPLDCLFLRQDITVSLNNHLQTTLCHYYYHSIFPGDSTAVSHHEPLSGHLGATTLPSIIPPSLSQPGPQPGVLSPTMYNEVMYRRSGNFHC